MNGVDTRWAYGDVIEVVTGARDALDVIVVPKVRRAGDVWWVDTLLTQLEGTLGLERRIGLEVLIEEAEGLQYVDEIAQVGVIPVALPVTGDLVGRLAAVARITRQRRRRHGRAHRPNRADWLALSIIETGIAVGVVLSRHGAQQRCGSSVNPSGAGPENDRGSGSTCAAGQR